MSEKKISVLIVDDHAVVRQGLRFLLEQQPDIIVVGESENGQQALQQVSELLPQVVLLDLIMPGMDGIKATRAIKRISPATQIIILTSYYEDDQIFNGIKSGALSYLLKDMGPQELINAVHAAARGESVLHPKVAARVLQEVKGEQHSALDDLTERELSVLTRIAHGRSNREIAADLGIGKQTVKTHVSNILSKLHLADRTQAAIYALQQRLVPLEEAMNPDQTPREEK